MIPFRCTYRAQLALGEGVVDYLWMLYLATSSQMLFEECLGCCRLEHPLLFLNALSAPFHYSKS